MTVRLARLHPMNACGMCAGMPGRAVLALELIAIRV